MTTTLSDLVGILMILNMKRPCKYRAHQYIKNAYDTVAKTTAISISVEIRNREVFPICASST